MYNQTRHILLLIVLSMHLISCQTTPDSILVYTGSNGKQKKVRNASDWQKRSAQILDSMQLVMGPLPDVSGKVPPDQIISEDTIINGIRRIRFSYASEKNDRVPAFLLMPASISQPVPGILCLHQTTDYGKAEPAGLGGNPNLQYAYELAERGYVTLAPDYPNFGDYKFDPYSNGFVSATMKGIWNHMAAIDLLQSLPEVDPERIGCIGHSLGGHNTLFLAAFDKRVRAAVTSCGFTSFHKYYEGNLEGWAHKGYMPKIISVYNADPDKMPFDFSDILAVIAPRPVFINAPLKDSNFEVSGVHDCVNAALPVYKLFKAEDKIILKNPDAFHDFPTAEREEAYEFLDRELNMKNPVVPQKLIVNYDEAKVPSYTLPDPLVLNNGRKVTDKKEWPGRRDQIMKLFETEVYGISPEWKGRLSSQEISSDMNALDGKAIRKEIKITLQNEDKSHNMILLLYLPKSSSPAPVFLGLNFGGNHTVTSETSIGITPIWVRNDEKTGVNQNKATEAGRGTANGRWQVNELISRGYGLATMYYGDIDPDYDDNFKNGVHSLYEAKRASESWGTIAAWAWGLSRIMDYLETNPAIDSKKVVVMGHSRLGKAALWAGARDKRFSIIISNNSGCGGAALSMRAVGETVGMINRAFPHWFCDNFSKYNENEGKLPVDQHELIALVAPRPVYVASAEEDKWADPRGEYLSCLYASPVYELLGKQGLKAKDMPAVNQPVMGTIGYHIRSGVHDVTLYDWQQYLNFADLHLK